MDNSAAGKSHRPICLYKISNGEPFGSVGLSQHWNMQTMMSCYTMSLSNYYEYHQLNLDDNDIEL